MLAGTAVVSALSVLALFLTDAVLAQTCKTETLQSTMPTDGSEVALNTCSYCGGSLNVTVYIANLCYNKVVRLYYTNAQNQSTPLSVASLNWIKEIDGTNYAWELCTYIRRDDTTSLQSALLIHPKGGANISDAYLDGLTEILNVTYNAVDIGKTYVDIVDLAVVASGAAAPTPAAPPKPYATPLGFSDDITKWLQPNKDSEDGIAMARMFMNINPNVVGAVNGTVVAAQSGPTYPQHDPDYEYDWVRDSSLTMDVVQTLYAAANSKTAKSQYETILFQYAGARATEQNDPGLQTGLGEPKFYLNNTIFTGPWGRPQNDGPATAAITLMEFAKDYLNAGGSLATVKSKIYDSATYPLQAPVMRDLLFVASNWSSPSFDLWEEEEADHFYTRMVQRRALVTGATFAHQMGDAATSATLSSAAAAISATMSQFWDPNRQLILYEYGPVLHDKNSYIDIAVVLGVIHGYAGDGVYSYTNDEVLVSALKISTSFLPIYHIASVTSDASGQVLGIPIG
ncbi:hypothetical protein LTR28_007309 [Elasticomyces elasticus]|nr:hypothetical protein LTR28_007309 [Elasticomyces elasticus]